MDTAVSYLPLIEDMVWSYSRVETFSECPYKWFLKYICKCGETEKFFASYGKWMHKLIEKFYRGELSRSEMPTKFLVGFSENVKGERPRGTTVQKYIESGAEYFKSFQPFKYSMVDVEKQVKFEIGALKLVGFIDYLGRDEDGNFVIIDNKSRNLKPGSKKAKPTAKDGELDIMLRQLYLYSAAIKQEFGVFPKLLCFNCFRTGTFIEEPFREEAYDETIAWVKQQVEEIKRTENFHPNFNFFVCRYICGVEEECVYAQMARKGR